MPGDFFGSRLHSDSTIAQLSHPRYPILLSSGHQCFGLLTNFSIASVTSAISSLRSGTFLRFPLFCYFWYEYSLPPSFMVVTLVFELAIKVLTISWPRSADSLDCSEQITDRLLQRQKPRPFSPALAASMLALRERRFV